MRSLPRIRAHGVLRCQRCLSLSGSNLASVAKLLPTAESASGSLRIGDGLRHDAPGAVGELVDAPQLFGRAGEGRQDDQFGVRRGGQRAIRAGDGDLEVRRAGIAAGIRRRARSSTSAAPGAGSWPCGRRCCRRASSSRPAPTSCGGIDAGVPPNIPPPPRRAVRPVAGPAAWCRRGRSRTSGAATAPAADRHRPRRPAPAPCRCARTRSRRCLPSSSRRRRGQPSFQSSGRMSSTLAPPRSRSAS